MKIIAEPHPPLFKAFLIHNNCLIFFFKSQDRLAVRIDYSHVVLLDQDPLLRISENDKPESLACDENAERVECGLKMSVLMPDIISISFTQPATVDLATAL